MRSKSQYHIEKEANDRPFKERLKALRRQKRKVKPVAIDLDSEWRGYGDYHVHAVVIWDSGGIALSLENAKGDFLEVQLPSNNAKRFLEWAVKAKAEVEARQAAIEEYRKQESAIYREWSASETEREKAHRAKREALQKSAKAKLTEAEYNALYNY